VNDATCCHVRGNNHRQIQTGRPTLLACQFHREVPFIFSNSRIVNDNCMNRERAKVTGIGICIWTIHFNENRI
jgi:hypothetical protein